MYLSLSSRIRPSANVVDLLPSCNYWIQMKIWLGDRGTCNWLYLNTLADWTAWSLDEIRLFFWNFGNDHVSHYHPRATWTRVIIFSRLETDYYRWRLCFPLFSRRSGTRPRELCAPEDSKRKGGEQIPWAWTQAVNVASVFIVLWHASTGCQGYARPICCSICQVTVTFWRGTTFVVGAANQGRRFGSDLSRQM